jgi:hypothetical protein
LAVGVIATTPIPSEAVFVLALGWIGAIVLRMPQAEWERTGDFAAHNLSDFVARRQLHCLEMHAEFFRPNGVEYELEVGLPAPPWHTKVVGFDSGSRDFGERDRLLLDLLRPHLVSLYESAKTRRLAAALAAGARRRENLSCSTRLPGSSLQACPRVACCATTATMQTERDCHRQSRTGSSTIAAA